MVKTGIWPKIRNMDEFSARGVRRAFWRSSSASPFKRFARYRSLKLPAESMECVQSAHLKPGVQKGNCPLSCWGPERKLIFQEPFHRCLLFVGGKVFAFGLDHLRGSLQCPGIRNRSRTQTGTYFIGFRRRGTQGA